MPWRIASFAEACWKSMKQIDSLRNGKEWGCSFTRGCWFKFAWRGHCSICFFSEFVSLIHDYQSYLLVQYLNINCLLQSWTYFFAWMMCSTVYIHEIPCSHDVMTLMYVTFLEVCRSILGQLADGIVFMQQMCFKTTFLRWFMIPSWRFPSLRCHPWFWSPKTFLNSKTPAQLM